MSHIAKINLKKIVRHRHVDLADILEPEDKAFDPADLLVLCEDGKDRKLMIKIIKACDRLGQVMVEI